MTAIRGVIGPRPEPSREPRPGSPRRCATNPLRRAGGLWSGPRRRRPRPHRRPQTVAAQGAAACGPGGPRRQQPTGGEGDRDGARADPLAAGGRVSSLVDGSLTLHNSRSRGNSGRFPESRETIGRSPANADQARTPCCRGERGCGVHAERRPRLRACRHRPRYPAQWVTLPTNAAGHAEAPPAVRSGGPGAPREPPDSGRRRRVWRWSGGRLGPAGPVPRRVPGGPAGGGTSSNASTPEAPAGTSCSITAHHGAPGRPVPGAAYRPSYRCRTAHEHTRRAEPPRRRDGSGRTCDSRSGGVPGTGRTGEGPGHRVPAPFTPPAFPARPPTRAAVRVTASATVSGSSRGRT